MWCVSKEWELKPEPTGVRKARNHIPEFGKGVSFFKITKKKLGLLNLI